MRIIYALMVAVMLLTRLSVPADQPRDIVIVVDVSAMTPQEAGNEPWLSAPCLNPEHHYYKPLAVGDSRATYPTSRGDEVDQSKDYRFRSCFLLEEDAIGWRPWDHHYARSRDGEPIRIADSEQAGCFYASDLCRARALELIQTMLAQHPDCRIALCCVGGPFDTRFCVNFTRDEETLTNALYAATPSGIGDLSTALNKAGSYLQRRDADERRARPAAVVVLSVEGENDGLYTQRIQQEMQQLLERATIVWVSPLEFQGADIIRLLGFERQVPDLPPLPISLRAEEANRVYRAP